MSAWSIISLVAGLVSGIAAAAFIVYFLGSKVMKKDWIERVAKIEPLTSKKEVLTEEKASNELLYKVAELESDLKELRELLFDDPEASITIPLLKRDVESIKKEISRVYSFNKWFLGIMVTLSLGLIGVAISLLLKG